MVDAKCSPFALSSTLCCMCCMYLMYKPIAATRSGLKSYGAPVPFNLTLMWCILSCCLSSGVLNISDCGLQYTGLNHKLGELIGYGKSEEST